MKMTDYSATEARIGATLLLPQCDMATSMELGELMQFADGLRKTSMYLAAARRLSEPRVPASACRTDVLDKAADELRLLRIAFLDMCERLLIRQTY